METEYRKATAGTKVTCRLCNKKFYPDKLRMHRCDNLMSVFFMSSLLWYLMETAQSRRMLPSIIKSRNSEVFVNLFSACVMTNTTSLRPPCFPNSPLCIYLFFTLFISLSFFPFLSLHLSYSFPHTYSASLSIFVYSHSVSFPSNFLENTSSMCLGNISAVLVRS